MSALRPAVFRERAHARSFCFMSTNLQHDVETRLGQNMPEVEVLLVEVAAGTLRVTIDHPGGVTLGVCEQVTHELSELRERFAVEVSSPGRERPLTKPDHFRRYLGRRARVRTRQPRDGHKSFTGELVGASEAEVTIAADDGLVSIAYADIHRSNLVEE
jgi:ribosome maturation factor RimP